MLHLITEIGKPGHQEREKRHYGDHNKTSGFNPGRPHGRRYIPHGYGEEPVFRPHAHMIQPSYSDCGLDWKSRPRRIPSPQEQENKPEIWPDSWHSLRTLPWMGRKTQEEWQLFPGGLDASLRSQWMGNHKASQQSADEITQTMLFGNKRKVYVVDKRNGVPMAAPGDKSYQVVEYSPSFHKQGSTLPVVNFGTGKTKNKREEYLVLQELPKVPSPSYCVKEQQRQKNSEITEVQILENWRPATPLLPPPKPQEV